MENKVEWIEYKGKKILYVDARGLKGDDFFKIVEDYEKIIIPLEKKSILVLLNVTDVYSNSKIQEKQKQVAGLGRSRAAAVVGVVGIKKVLAKVIKPDFYFASSIEDAKEWLIKQ